MVFLGKNTETILRLCHVTSADIEEIKKGRVNWTVLKHHLPKGEARNVLCLELTPDPDPETGQINRGLRSIIALNDTQESYLRRISKFEKINHEHPIQDRPTLFEAGDPDDWMGISEKPSWDSFIKEYRCAADALSELHSRTPNPFMFICRHTLELQLKRIVLLENEIRPIESFDFKTNHFLMAWWDRASPIASRFNEKLRSNPSIVTEIVKQYDKVDHGSYSMRYPTDFNNDPIPHEKYLYSFSHAQFLEKFQLASNTLDKVIHSMKIDALFGDLDEKIHIISES